jgi:hypothetical protein
VLPLYFLLTGAGKDRVRHGGDQDDGGAAGAADRIGPGDGHFKRFQLPARGGRDAAGGTVDRGGFSQGGGKRRADGGAADGLEDSYPIAGRQKESDDAAGSDSGVCKDAAEGTGGRKKRLNHEGNPKNTKIRQKGVLIRPEEDLLKIFSLPFAALRGLRGSKRADGLRLQGAGSRLWD